MQGALPAARAYRKGRPSCPYHVTSVLFLPLLVLLEEHWSLFDGKAESHATYGLCKPLVQTTLYSIHFPTGPSPKLLYLEL